MFASLISALIIAAAVMMIVMHVNNVPIAEENSYEGREPISRSDPVRNFMHIFHTPRAFCLEHSNIVLLFIGIYLGAMAGLLALGVLIFGVSLMSSFRKMRVLSKNLTSRLRRVSVHIRQLFPYLVTIPTYHNKLQTFVLLRIVLVPISRRPFLNYDAISSNLSSNFNSSFLVQTVALVIITVLCSVFKCIYILVIGEVVYKARYEPIHMITSL